MLRCIFGKCSSETYVVNQLPRQQSQRSAKPVNGITKIVSLPTELPSPTTDNVPNNHYSVPEIVIQVDQNSNSDNQAPSDAAPVLVQPSSQNGKNKNSENKMVLDDQGQKEQRTINVSNNNATKTSPTSKIRPHAPLPSEEKLTVVKENKVSTSASTSTKVEKEEVNIRTEQKDFSKEKETIGSKSEASAKSVKNDVMEIEDKVTSKEKDIPGSNKEISAKSVKKEVIEIEEKNSSKEKEAVSNKEAFTKTEKKEVIEIEEKDFSKDKETISSNKEIPSKAVKKEVIELEEKDSGREKETTGSTKETSTKIVKKETVRIQEKGSTKKTVTASSAKEPSVRNVKEIVETEEEDSRKVTETIDFDKETSIKNVENDENLNKDKRKVRIDVEVPITTNGHEPSQSKTEEDIAEVDEEPVKRRSGIVPLSVKYDESANAALPNYPKDPDDEALIKKAIETNDFLSKIISGKRLEDIIQCMYNKEISSKETIIKQGEKGSHMYVSAKGTYQVLVKGKVVSDFHDVRVFGELAILYNAKRLATIKALTAGRVWVLDRSVYQQIMVQYNIKEQDEIMQFLMNNNKLNVVGKEALQEVANLLKSEFFSAGKQIVRQGDKGYKFYIIRAGTVTITKDGEGVVGKCKKGDCFGELALLKEDCRQATVTADAPGVECLTLTRKEFIDHFGELTELTEIKVRPQENSIKDIVAEHEDINLTDLKIIKTLGVGGFGRVELVQHTKRKDLVFALKYLKKIDIVMQHQEDHVFNEKNIQMSSRSPFIVRLYRTYKNRKYIYLLMESCLGGDLWSLLQKQKLKRFDENEARFIAGCVLEAFEYLHSRGIIYRDLKPENLLIASNGYIKLTDFGFAKKISARGRTFTFAGTPEYVAPEIVLNKGHDRAVDYWAFGAFIFELLTGRTPFRTDDSSHMKTYNKILNGIDNIQFPSHVKSKARNIVEKLCRPIPSERLGMQRGGIKDIKTHKWFLGFDWQKFAKCEISSPFKPKLKNPTDTQYFDHFKKDTDIPPDETTGWDAQF